MKPRPTRRLPHPTPIPATMPRRLWAAPPSARRRSAAASPSLASPLASPPRRTTKPSRILSWQWTAQSMGMGTNFLTPTSPTARTRWPVIPNSRTAGRRRRTSRWKKQSKTVAHDFGLLPTASYHYRPVA